MDINSIIQLHSSVYALKWLSESTNFSHPFSFQYKDEIRERDGKIVFLLYDSYCFIEVLDHILLYSLASLQKIYEVST